MKTPITSTCSPTGQMQDIHQKAAAIAARYHPEKIILFGSQASGDANADSDIDLLVILETNRPTFEVSVEIAMMLDHNIPIDILVKTPGEISRRLKMGDFFYQNILENGLVLYERNC
ncbi:MAG: nucleotidyltransferase domain-containing protein [Methanobacteriota archaeon]|nr:MAG: nucleotidyltransferase domain-containing protein [Euryarchaeota archaeon]